MLVDRYRDRVLSLALRITRDAEAGEEIAQDAFVRAWRALPHFRGESRFSTWLYSIAMRRALDERAAASRRRDREVHVDAEALARFEAPAQKLPDSSLRARVERLVGELPEMQRACITLFYAGDQSVDEIARVLDIPSGTVKTHLFRAREALRRKWDRESGQEASHAPR
jgi:RNA polymerase sigma-70 factor (ECF subfamily)